MGELWRLILAQGNQTIKEVIFDRLHKMQKNLRGSVSGGFSRAANVWEEVELCGLQQRCMVQYYWEFKGL